jgi:hypothetical protein
VGVYLDRSSEELLKFYEMEEAEKERKRAAKKAAQEAARAAKAAAEDRAENAAEDEIAEEAANTEEAFDDGVSEALEAFDNGGEAVLQTAVEDGEAQASDEQADEAAEPQNGNETDQNNGELSEKPIGRLPKIDFTTAKFYIPKELKHRADVRFERRGSSWAPAIASIALVILMTGVVCWLLPYVLTLADGIISLMAPQ